MPISAGLRVELVHQVNDGEETTALAPPNTGPGDAHGEVRLARPGRTDQHDIALMVEELTTSQIAHERLVHRRIVKGELVDLLGQRQLGDGHLVFDRACLLLADLGVQEIADDLLRLMLTLYRRGDDLIVGDLMP